MPRACTVCRHADREGIDRELVEGRSSIRDIARRFATTKDAVARHRSHVPASLAKAGAAAEVARGDSLLEQVRQLVADARRIQGVAETAGDHRTALGAIREQGRVLELVARLVGELDSGTTVNVAVVHVEPTADELEHEARLALELVEEMRASRVVTVAADTPPTVTEGTGP
jgi:hypothetical protein